MGSNGSSGEPTSGSNQSMGGSSSSSAGAKGAAGNQATSRAGSAGVSRGGASSTMAGANNATAGALDATGGAGTSSASAGATSNAGGSLAAAGRAQGGMSNGAGDSSTGPGHPTCADGLRIVARPGTAPDTGAVVEGTNCVGIHGNIVLSADTHGSAIGFTSLDDHICVSGHTGAVSDGDYEQQWGAAIGIELNDSLSYDALSYGLRGFSFELTGSSIPPEVRPTFFVSYGSNEGYCNLLCASGAQSVILDETSPSCWTGPGSGELGFGSQLMMLGFGIGGLPVEVPFDFCIEKLSALTSLGPSNPGTCTTTCTGRCGQRGSWCGCDSDCEARGDCCINYADQCQ